MARAAASGENFVTGISSPRNLHRFGFTHGSARDGVYIDSICIILDFISKSVAIN